MICKYTLHVREGGRKEDGERQLQHSLPAALICREVQIKKEQNKNKMKKKSLKWKFEIKKNGKLYIHMHLTVILPTVWF